MDAAEAGRRLSALLGADAASLAVEAGFGSWAEALTRVPGLGEPDDLAVPGLGVALVAREYWSRAGELRPAAALTRGVVQALADRLGDRHPDVLAEIAVLGSLAMRAGRADRAVELLRDAWTGLRDAGAVARLPAVARCFAEALEARGLGVEADGVLQATLVLSVGRPAYPALALLLAEALLRRGDDRGAVKVVAQAWTGMERPSLPLARSASRLLVQAGGFEEALGPTRALVGLAVDAEARAEALALHVRALEGSGRREEATRTLEAAVAAARGAAGPALAGRLGWAASLWAARRRHDEAEALLWEALEAERRHSGEDGVEVARRLWALGRFLGRQGRGEEAAGALEACQGPLRRAGEHQEAEAAHLDLVAALTAEADRLRRAGDREMADAWLAQARKAQEARPR